jgi:CHRD domain
MRTIRTGLVAAIALGLVATACGSDDDSGGTPNTTSTQQVVFSVSLTGAAEAPGPGSTDGRGTARITVDPQRDEVCFELSTSSLPNVTAAHIHEGRGGTAGPIAVTLTTPQDGKSEGCVPASGSIVKAIASGDRSFYVNVHTTEFPDGAIRAQLTG